MTESSKKHIGRFESVNEFASNEHLRAFLADSCNHGVWAVNADQSSSYEQDPDNEFHRLMALKSYNVLDQDTDSAFERVTSLAARIFDVPICLVSFVDLGRQWFASNRGLRETKETERNLAFCAHTILSKHDLVVVPDATKDMRFKENALVVGRPSIRFYAGAPLVTPDGFKLGTVCIIDTKPWPNGLDLSQKQNLLEMSGMIMDTINIRLNDRYLMERDRSRFIASTAHEMLTPLTTIQLNLGLLDADKNLKNKMNEINREMLNSTIDCVGLLTTICNQTIESFRSSRKKNPYEDGSSRTEEVSISDVLKRMKHVITPLIRKVPVSFDVADDVPSTILTDPVHLSGAMMNVLVDSIESSKAGSIMVTIAVRKLSTKKGESPREMLLFECVSLSESNIDDEKQNLRTDAAFNHVKALDGEYGFRRHEDIIDKDDNENKHVLWFTIPLRLPLKFIQNTVKKETQFRVPSPIPVDIHSGRKRKENDSETSDQERRLFLKKSQIDDSSVTVPSEEESECSYHYTNKNSGDFSIRKKCALIIDDTLIIRKVFIRALSTMGFVVKQAENGLKGLLEMKTVMFDVIFCDFLMPVMDGLDCVQQYRQWERENRNGFHQYIVGISAHADSDDASRGLNVGMNMYLQKPILLEKLKSIVKSEEVVDNMKKLDKLSRKSEYRPFCLFEHDSEVAETDETSFYASSDLETSQHHLTCLIAEGVSEIIKTMSRCVIRKGWRIRLVKNGVEALQIMKMRNWDAVFIDNNLPLLCGKTCISLFKTWEAENRIASQRNIYMISSEFNNDDHVEVPSGFDGVINTPISQDQIDSVLSAAEVVQKKPSIL